MYIAFPVTQCCFVEVFIYVTIRADLLKPKSPLLCRIALNMLLLCFLFVALHTFFFQSSLNLFTVIYQVLKHYFIREQEMVKRVVLKLELTQFSLVLRPQTGMKMRWFLCFQRKQLIKFLNLKSSGRSSLGQGPLKLRR